MNLASRYLFVQNPPNYYQLLHVQPDAPAPVIKASYRAMMQKMRLHPDLGGEESQAKNLNEAFATLCKPDRREQYDRWLAAKTQNQSSYEPNPGGKPTHAKANNDQSSSQGNRKSGRGGTNHEARGGAYKASPNDHVAAHTHLPSREQCPFCHAAYASAASTITGYLGNQRCAQCKGAKTPIESVAFSMADDIRKIYRHTHKTDVSLHIEWPTITVISASMTDLSLAGCAVLCTESLSLRTIIMLDTHMLNGICQVRYRKPFGQTKLYSIGLEFLTLDIVAGPGSVFSATA